ncbi:hypothetical protein AB0J51_22485 [Micromonospora echinofusca]|uniref:P-loop ATPase, Sll1717 family n=1 Tax=Micromonospora echinofusca TaxID=47858 RepID=UPI00343FBA9C
MPSIFFGYAASPPSHTELIRNAARIISEQTGAETVLWQDMVTDGRIVIDRVKQAIDDASMCIVDLTHQSENVLFEAGFAIARAKPVWLTFDSTVTSSKEQWNEFALLKPVGYTAYFNSSDLAARFAETDPLVTLEPVYDDLIDPILPVNARRDSLLYCSTFAPFEAATRLSTYLDQRRRRGLNLLVSDPSESTLAPIDWIAPQIAKAAGVLIHFSGRRRSQASLFNRRNAFVAGLASGLDVPVLLLSEEDYLTPFDYQTLLRKYDTAEECVQITREWLDSLSFESIRWAGNRASQQQDGISVLRFGQHVAENELSELADYFVPTAAFGDVVAARDAIFVGQRGTGKTANATQAYDQVAGNRDNMAVLIKPPGFEFPALFAVIAKLPSAQHDYFFDALWRFVVQTEIAAAALSRIENKLAGVPLDQVERNFIAYANAAPFDIRTDMSVRLEQALDHLSATVDTSMATEASRNLINEAFHDRALVELRAQLGPVLKSRKRVAVFVDNLDKGWERGADFKLVARLILGLLVARGRVVRDFEKQDWWRDRIKLTVSMFLRSDIYAYLRNEAREPDKLPISTITWADSETLLRVLEDRFLASEVEPQRASELWTKIFCEQVQGVPIKDYITSVVLPRPRDIVFFCNAAVGRAIDRRHERVEESDFLSAEGIYSQYAYEALLVENGVTIPEMQDALFGFLGAKSVMTRAEALAAIAEAGFQLDRREHVLEKLIGVSFFGIEVARDRFVYPDVGTSMARAQALAARLDANPAGQRLKVHRAYHSFLEIAHPGLSGE